jgi:serine/threonine-protein kinase
LEEGRIIGGRWRIARQLAVGGGGVVYVVEDARDEIVRPLALKVCSRMPGLVDRALREIAINRRIRSGWILPMADAGLVDDAPFLVMDLATQGTFDAQIERNVRVSPEDAALVVAQAARGVAASGCIHRDLKPANLFLFPPRAENLHAPCPWHVCVGDWGISRDIDDVDSEESLTQRRASDRTMATIGYAPPEQRVDLSSVDARSDVYALGVTWFHAVLGQRGFLRFCERGPADMRWEPPTLPAFVTPELATVMLQAVAHFSARRHADCLAFAQAVEAACRITVPDARRESGMVPIAGAQPSKGATSTFRKLFGGWRR